ncbi:MAG: HAD family hydrolase [Verrucomicrobiota bacterium]
MIRAAIFDLDNCLAPATAVGEALFEPAFAAIRNANHGNLSEEKLETAFDEIWRHPLDWVAERYGFTDEMRSAGWQVFQTLEVAIPMEDYGDLEALDGLGMDCYLVTSGFRKLQESKIKALGLFRFFREMIVDGIDELDRLGKKGYFEQIIERGHLNVSEVLIVGDNADSEIAAGNDLGMLTLQTLRPGVPRTNNADYHIPSLWQMKTVLESINS